MKREMRIAKIVAKTGLRRELRRERLKLRKDHARIEAIELAMEADELLEMELEALVDNYITERPNSAGLSDSDWFKDFLDWLSSPEFQDFIDTIISLIKTLVDLFGGAV